MARPIITLTTDYGTSDHFVGVMKGVILSINPDVNMVDITHSVIAHDILDGALAIGQAYKYFPPKTVHVVVVDPGVGTERRPILVAGDQHYFVAPDNGVLSCCLRPVRIALRLAHHFRALFPPAGQQHLSRPRHFRARRRVAYEILADLRLRRAHHRLRPLRHARKRKSSGDTHQGHRAAHGPLRQSDHEHHRRGRPGAGGCGRTSHDQRRETERSRKSCRPSRRARPAKPSG